jgi:FkbM family methyltransferase
MERERLARILCIDPRAAGEVYFQAVAPDIIASTLTGSLWKRRELALAVYDYDADLFSNERMIRIGNILAKYSINYFIDVGAHTGEFARTVYGYAGFRGTCVSFEPVTASYEAMVNKLPDWPGWRAVNVGVSDVPGVASINIGRGDRETSSLLEQTPNLERLAPEATFNSKEEIKLVRLDQYLLGDLENPANRIFLKIDAQGSEDKILSSVEKYLDHIPVIMLECSALEFYRGQALIEDLIAYLRRFGFFPAYFSNNFYSNGLFYDYDVIFVRK